VCKQAREIERVSERAASREEAREQRPSSGSRRQHRWLLYEGTSRTWVLWKV